MKSRPRKFPVASMALALLLAGEPGASRVEGWPAVFHDTADVTVWNVDVWVHDGDGNPVTGLSADDFVVRVDGEEVEITNFSALGGQVGEAEAQPRTRDEPKPVAEAPPAEPVHDQPASLLVYVDNRNISAPDRARVTKHLEAFLRGRWQSGVAVALASNGGSLVIHQGLTRNPDLFFSSLAQLGRTTPFGPRLELERQNLMERIAAVNVEAGSGLFGTKDGVGAAGHQEMEEQSLLSARTATEAESLLPRIRAYAEQSDLHVRESLQVLAQAIDAAAGLPGRRALLYVSNGLSLRPAESLYEAFSRRFAALGNTGAQVSSSAEAARYDLRPALLELTTLAASSQVSIYPFFAAPSAVATRGSAASVASAGGNFGSWDDAVPALEELDHQEPLQLMAERTGGRAALSPAAYDVILASLLDDFGTYYSLGCRLPPASAAGSDRRHQVKVDLRAPRRDLSLRFRETFREKTPSEQARQRLLSALLLGTSHNPLEVSLELREPDRGESGQWTVPLLVEIPIGQVILLPEADEHRARLSVVVATSDAEGGVSELQQHLCPLRIPNSELLVALGRTMACEVRLVVRPGSHEVAVTVRDELAAADSTVTLAFRLGSSGVMDAVRSSEPDR